MNIVINTSRQPIIAATISNKENSESTANSFITDIINTNTVPVIGKATSLNGDSEINCKSEAPIKSAIIAQIRPPIPKCAILSVFSISFIKVLKSTILLFIIRFICILRHNIILSYSTF